jgi:hypothetical protein
LVPATLIVWLVLRPWLKAKRTDADELAKVAGARSDLDMEIGTYLGLFVPFVVFCGCAGVCATINSMAGTQDEVRLQGIVVRTDVGRWTGNATVTVSLASGDEVRVPIPRREERALKKGQRFDRKYLRGSLGLLHL